MTVNELWKQYRDTNYEVSSEGRVYNTKTEKYLKGTYQRNEYHTVQFVIEGRPVSLMTHRLVAELFCENPNGYPIVDHIDRNKHNNRSSNLRWVPQEVNVQNCERTGFRNKSVYIEKLDDFEELCVGDGEYLVSRDGIIVKASTHRVLNGQLRNGYRRIFINGKPYSAHVLIWESFMGRIEKGYVVDHIDGNRSNNTLSNLRKVSQSENVYNAYENGHKAKKEVYQYDLNGFFMKTFGSLVEASNEVKCTPEAINSAIKREGTCAGFFWSDKKVDETPEELREKIKKNTTRDDAKGISQYDEDGVLIAHYLSLAAAAKSAGCATSTITRGNANKRKAKGYYWILDTDDYTIEDLIK